MERQKWESNKLLNGLRTEETTRIHTMVDRATKDIKDRTLGKSGCSAITDDNLSYSHKHRHRRRSHSDGEKDEPRLTKLAIGDNGMGDHPTAAILHSGHLLKKNEAHQGARSWEQHFCVLSTCNVEFFVRRGDATPVLQVALENITWVVFYQNVNSLIQFDRENCFEFELTEGSTKAGRIRVATASVEECRIWSSILKKAMVPCKLT